jgi:RNA polymerase sigma-70 factor (ECF subfamily)
MLAGRLQRLVASLPPKPRLLVVLRYQEEMELEEIAEALDMPLGTVKSQLQRTLATLREKAYRTLGEMKS